MSKVYVDLSPIAFEFEAARAAVFPMEISGFGFVTHSLNAEGDYVFLVYDWVFLDVGTYDFTIISSDQVREFKDHKNAKDMKVWLHSHPVGDGEPGDHITGQARTTTPS